MTTATENSESQTIEFQAEARQLLQLMIHSIYSNKDIFLRELVSNASDALDKLRLLSYQDKDLQADTSDLHIELEIDREQRTLTVRDNGIGMTRDEVVELIGTIAKSGTAQLLASLRENADSAPSQELIGQFGVGFYSCFMVADKVTLVTRKAGTEAGVRWESAGEGSYTIAPAGRRPAGHRGDPAPQARGRRGQPARLRVGGHRAPDHQALLGLHHLADPDDGRGAAGSTDSEETPEPETLNSRKALWARPKSDVSAEEYTEFYRHVSHDWQEPLETIRLAAEGTFEYQALLFLPAHPPLDLFMRERRRGVQLYVRRVFIMDDCEQLIPEYLRFVKGVVDAADLSLNVSREILQQDRQIQLIRRRLVKKVLSTVATMMTDEAEKYATFWTGFGRAVKEGLLEDPDNREQILQICSFASTHHESEPTALAGYVERMREGQEHIYYLTGDSRSAIEASPHMEAFRERGYEVLLLSDPIDEIWVDAVPAFDGKEFRSIAKGELDLDADAGTDDAEREQRKQDFAGLLSWLGDQLTEQVKEVRLSTRLTTSPACLVGDTHDMTPTLERMYRAMGQELPTVKRILELNPTPSAGHRAAREARGQPGRRGAARDGGAGLRDGAAGRGRGADRPGPVRVPAGRPAAAHALIATTRHARKTTAAGTRELGCRPPGRRSVSPGAGS